ncbi:MAG: TetR/AcrR family transcriptional regulator [Muribaculaceae bacterium]|nr:TetR/AcrR family transcriptional regulator [Muribaculaceae bacterium]
MKETELKLLEAVSQIIENDGFTKIGINRIANQAGCDKVLIYRYFGGLDGLLSEWAKRHDYYSFAYYELTQTIKDATPYNAKRIVKDVLLQQLHYLKDNVLMQELLVWELSGKSTFKIILEEREKAGLKLQDELNNYLKDINKDSSMYMTILISSINYIVLFTRQYHKINGIDFSDEKSWEKLEEVISKYVDFMFTSVGI